jgi:pimeloyl-ACP methyl ester carboxylesterase
MDMQSNGIRINVRKSGEGALALVFLHYWGGSSRSWRYVMEELADTYTTVASDHRGWGESDAPATGYALADLADDAQGVIESLGLKRYVLVGHSMGGKAAQLLASRRPQGLEALVLIAPSPPTPTLIGDEQRTFMAHAYDSRESVEFVVDQVLTGDTKLTGALREQVIEDSLRGATQAKSGWLDGAMREDITQHVASIDVPVLVIAGERDQVDRVETLRAELLPHIAHARLVMLTGVGHLSPLEAPEEIAAMIKRFISDRDD